MTADGVAVAPVGHERTGPQPERGDGWLERFATLREPKQGRGGGGRSDARPDVERAVGELCACDVRPFFDGYVRAAGALDFNRWLGVVGLRTAISWSAALTSDGVPAPDLRVSANELPGTPALQLKIFWFPGTPWGRAGLHTGDRLESPNGVTIRDLPQFRTALGHLRIGDTVRVSVRRASMLIEKTITIAGYERPTVRVEMRPDVAPGQRRLFRQWMAGH